MPKFERKSPEVLKAQMAAFAAEGVEDYRDKAHILKNINILAEGEAQDLTRMTGDKDYRKVDGKLVDIVSNTEITVATKEDYLSFLRSVKGSSYEAIQGRVDMLKAYAVFAPSITQLKFELQSLESIREHPAYLGHGSGSNVFSIEYDDKQYAVRIPGHKADAFISPNTVDSHINGAVLGRGVAHLEQIVAASYEDGVTVAEMMPGKEISYLTAEEIQQITDVQLEDLVTTLQTVSQRGIEIDPKPSNFFYDERKGFGVVDYASSKEKGKSSRDQNLSEIVGWMGTVIANAGFYKGKSPETVEDYAQALEKDTANLDILKRYRAITAKNLANQEGLQEALEVIDKRINNIAETVANYSNPEYVTERIVEDARWKKERENATPLSWLEG